eukprot:tig00021348_g20565.t1
MPPQAPVSGAARRGAPARDAAGRTAASYTPREYQIAQSRAAAIAGRERGRQHAREASAAVIRARAAFRLKSQGKSAAAGAAMALQAAGPFEGFEEEAAEPDAILPLQRMPGGARERLEELVPNLPRARVLVFIDHDNCQNALPALLDAGSALQPGKAFVLAFHGPDVPTRRLLQQLNNKGSVREVQSRTGGKNAADVALTFHAAGLHVLMPPEAAFLIVSGDKAYAELAQQLTAAGRRADCLNAQQTHLGRYLYPYLRAVEKGLPMLEGRAGGPEEEAASGAIFQRAMDKVRERLGREAPSHKDKLINMIKFTLTRDERIVVPPRLVLHELVESGDVRFGEDESAEYLRPWARGFPRPPSPPSSPPPLPLARTHEEERPIGAAPESFGRRPQPFSPYASSASPASAAPRHPYPASLASSSSAPSSAPPLSDPSASSSSAASASAFSSAPSGPALFIGRVRIASPSPPPPPPPYPPSAPPERPVPTGVELEAMVDAAAERLRSLQAEGRLLPPKRRDKAENFVQNALGARLHAYALRPTVDAVVGALVRRGLLSLGPGPGPFSSASSLEQHSSPAPSPAPAPAARKEAPPASASAAGLSEAVAAVTGRLRAQSEEGKLLPPRRRDKLVNFALNALGQGEEARPFAAAVVEEMARRGILLLEGHAVSYPPNSPVHPPPLPLPAQPRPPAPSPAPPYGGGFCAPPPPSAVPLWRDQQPGPAPPAPLPPSHPTYPPSKPPSYPAAFFPEAASRLLEPPASPAPPAGAHEPPKSQLPTAAAQSYYVPVPVASAAASTFGGLEPPPHSGPVGGPPAWAAPKQGPTLGDFAKGPGPKAAAGAGAGAAVDEKHAKAELHEQLQKRGANPPSYRLTADEGPPHARVFTVECYIDGALRGIGKGPSKNHAERAAAADALAKLSGGGGGGVGGAAVPLPYGSEKLVPRSPAEGQDFQSAYSMPFSAR